MLEHALERVTEGEAFVADLDQGFAGRVLAGTQLAGNPTRL